METRATIESIRDAAYAAALSAGPTL